MLDQLDFVAGNCRLFSPTLFERIGSMAVEANHRLTRSHRVHWQRLRRSRLTGTSVAQCLDLPKRLPYPTARRPRKSMTAREGFIAGASRRRHAEHWRIR
jgi:hypothetical protein